MSRARQISRMFAKTGLYTSCAAIPIITIAGAYYHRPLPDLKSDHWGGPSHYDPKPATEEQLEKRKNPQFSKQAVIERGREEAIISSFDGNKDSMIDRLCDKILQVGYSISQFIVLNAVNLVIVVGMNSNVYNRFRSHEDERYEYLLSSIYERGEGEALLTVSNHCSTIDDPTLFGAMIPATLVCSPFEYDKIRWTLCSQEICFKNDLVGSIFGAGKVLPIKRGAGISQPLLHEFALKVASYDWVHVFPEGKIIQSGMLGSNYFGTRTKEQAEKIGKLKWGVGKLIAHSSVPIRVIPFHHVGMEGIVPQKKTGEIIYKYPLGGCDVKVRVGERIVFDDLISDYEQKYGTLYKYGEKQQNMVDDQEQWRRSGEKEHELELYSKITRRIEAALEQLESETKKDADVIVQKAYKKLYTDEGIWDKETQ